MSAARVFYIYVSVKGTKFLQKSLEGILILSDEAAYAQRCFDYSR